jgi:hypothetical protein
VATVGIDISGWQPNEVPGDWLFVVVKTTDGLSVANPKAGSQWDFARRHPLRGLYHYARPGHSGGNAQAAFFAQDAIRRGFRPGVDLWQLDCENKGNELVTGPQWEGFVNSFMAEARAQLGARGFLYAGRYFHPEVFGRLCAVYPWWLPDYGPNDGDPHPFGAPANPVIHQFTTEPGSVDRNRVYNQAAWAALMGATPARQPYTAPQRMEGDAMPTAYSNVHTEAPHTQVASVMPSGDFYAFGENCHILVNGDPAHEVKLEATPFGRVVRANWAEGEQFLGSEAWGANGFTLLFVMSNGQCGERHYAFTAGNK